MSNNEHKVTGAVAASGRPTLMEVKVKPDGSVQKFPLELLGQSPRVAAGRYRLPRRIPSRVRVPFPIPSGSCSDGYFWARRPYSIYRFRAPGGEPVGHRVDAVTDVTITANSVRYRDLALDWWVLPDGTALEEDLEEFEMLVSSGVLSKDDSKKAMAARRTVTSRWDSVLSDLERIEASWAPDA